MDSQRVGDRLTELGPPGSHYVDCRIEELDGERLDLRGSHFEGCTFTRCSLRLAELTDARLDDCTFVNCDLMGVDLTRMRWGQFALSEPLRLVECRLDYANLHGLTLEGLVLYGSSLVEADLGEAILRGADLRHTDLTGARLHGADLGGADLSGATGYAIHPEHTRVDGTIVSLPEGAVVLTEMGMVVTAAPPRLTATERLDV